MDKELFLKIYVKACNYATDKVGTDPRCWHDILADKFLSLLEVEQIKKLKEIS